LKHSYQVVTVVESGNAEAPKEGVQALNRPSGRNRLMTADASITNRSGFMVSC